MYISKTFQQEGASRNQIWKRILCIAALLMLFSRPVLAQITIETTQSRQYENSEDIRNEINKALTELDIIEMTIEEVLSYGLANYSEDDISYLKIAQDLFKSNYGEMMAIAAELIYYEKESLYQKCIERYYDAIDVYEEFKVICHARSDYFTSCFSKVSDPKECFFLNYCFYCFYGSGVRMLSSCTPEWTFDFPTQIEYRGKSYSVYGEVLDFRGAKDLCEILLPETVFSIGDYSFTSLKSLRRVNMSEKVREIGEGAFYDCPSLDKFNLPSSIETIGDFAFSGTSLSEPIVLGDQLVYVPQTVTSYEVPQEIRIIKGGAFYNCQSLKELSMSESIEYIGPQAFWNCKSLEGTINIPNDKEIPYGICKGCENLTGVTIAKSVKRIMEQAFEGCASIKEFNLPDSLDIIGQDAFKGCICLIDFPIKSTNTEGLYLSTGVFSDCTLLEYVNLPEGTSAIACDIFSECKNLKEIVIPKSVTEVGSQAFGGCESLTNIYCLNPEPPTAVRTVVIEQSSWFDYRYRHYYTDSPKVTDITKYDFFDDNTYEHAILHVPAESVTAYANAEGWSSFRNIQPIVVDGITDKLEDGEISLTVYTMLGVLILDKGDRNALQRLPHGLYIVNGTKVSL